MSADTPVVLGSSSTVHDDGLVRVDASGIWTGSSLGVSWHCDCGWVSKRWMSQEDAVEEEVWPHMTERHGGAVDA